MTLTLRMTSRMTSSVWERRSLLTDVWVVFFIILLIQVREGSLLTMLSEGDVLVLSRGESVELDCEFQAKRYNLFDYPVLWKKAQLHEVTQVNIMGNINAPYVSSDRFEVKYSPEPPRYRLKLVITGVNSFDSGNYTCEIRGPQSILLGSVTHSVYVRAPTRRLAVTSDNGTTSSVSSDPFYQSKYTPGTLTLTEREPSSVKCEVTGGYPPPSVQFYLGHEDISRQFHFTNTALLTGSAGLREIVYDSQRWTHTFVARADDDGKILKCIATVPGLKSNISMVSLSVRYGPRIQCYRAGSYLGDEKVHIKCEIRAKPRISSIVWVIDEGTTLLEDEVINGYWTKSRRREDGVVESTLSLAKVELSSFKTYTLIAENPVQVTREEVELFRKYKSSSTQPLSRGKDGRQTREGSYAFANNVCAFSASWETILLSFTLSLSICQWLSIISNVAV